MESLIALAIALIMAAQQPNVPVELRAEALKVASIALQYAQTSAPRDTTILTPVSIGAETPVSQTTFSIERVSSTAVLGGNCQNVAVIVHSSDSNPVTFTHPETNATSTLASPARYIYRPQATSTTQTLRFTAGNGSGEITTTLLEPTSQVTDSYGVQFDQSTGKCR